jgi:integrase
MPREATGNTYEASGRWYARVTLAKGQRPSVPLPTCTNGTAADARGAVLAKLAARLRAAHVALDVARTLVERAGEAADRKALDKVLDAANAICSGEAVPMADPSKPLTFRQLGERWTSGELARLYPDHVRPKRSVRFDVMRFETHVYPYVPDVPIAAFTLDHAETVMRAIPSKRSAATRRHVGQLMHRLLGIAVFPLRLIKANPLPKGFLPKVGPTKAKGYLYPGDDSRLLGCRAVPLDWRILYGFLDREGPRYSEAAGLTWRDLDLDRGAVKLDENKTDDPRAWALAPGVAAALRALRAMREARGVPVGPDDRVFLLSDEDGDDGAANHGADRFRRYLKAAGIDRPELFERSKSRLRIRAHDLRATFITIALACGRSETWVADRTGHKSSVMINRYRRAARTAAELGLGDLARLDEAIPELAAGGPGKGSGNGSNRKQGVGKGSAAPSDSAMIPRGTEGGTRTLKPFRVVDFESTAFAIPPLRLGARG